MPVDSTFNETESSSEEGRDEAVAVQRTPGPPRPPRPGKRKGSGLIPMPSPQNGAFGQVDVSESDAAPGVDIEDERDEVFPLVSPRAKHAEPEESFADIDAELHETAPPAPLSGLLDAAGPVEATPPRAGSAHGYGREEPEPTLVGKVPDNLLELSGAGEENTRAFTAPRELIELARRRREERLDSKAPADAHLRDTQRPIRGAASDADAADAAPPIPVDSAPPRRFEDDAAPPIARTNSGEMEAVALPPRGAPDSEPRGSGPVIEVEPASEVSISVSFDADSAARAPVAPPSEQVPSRIQSGMSLKPALFLGALFVLVGVVIARWHELMQLLR